MKCRSCSRRASVPWNMVLLGCLTVGIFGCDRSQPDSANRTDPLPAANKSPTTLPAPRSSTTSPSLRRDLPAENPHSVADPLAVPLIDIGATVDARTLTPLSEYEGRIRHIVIHTPDEFIERLWTPIHDLLGALPDHTKITFVCNFDPACHEMRARIDEAGFSKRANVCIHKIDRPMLIWSRDRYIASRAARNATSYVWLVPQLVQNFDAARRNYERQIPKMFRAFIPNSEIAESPVALEGGNLLSTPRHVLIGENVLAENAAGMTPEQTQAELSRTFKPRVFLISDDSGTPPVGHIDMFISVVGADHVLIGSPRLAADIMAGADTASKNALNERLFAAADAPGPDFSAARSARFDQVAAEFERIGYRVTRIPYADSRNGDFIVTYNNILKETDGDRHIVYMPVYRVPALDAAARHAYESLGMEVREIDLSTVCHLLGSLRCMANVVERD